MGGPGVGGQAGERQPCSKNAEDYIGGPDSWQHSLGARRALARLTASISEGEDVTRGHPGHEDGGNGSLAPVKGRSELSGTK